MTFDGSTSRGEALVALRRALGAAGLDAPGLDARLLVQDALGLSGADLLAHPASPLGPCGADRLAAAACRRLAREPIARILGAREFWGLPFVLSSETLVPRPESETVVEAALAAWPDRDAPLQVLDLGVGSGCLLVAILSERPRAHGLGIDRAPGALRTARANAAALGAGGRCAFAASNWADAIAGPFDLVVSNPPYIATADISRLDPEVALHDPGAALDGGPDGLVAYRAITGALPRLLGEGGVAILELGLGQLEAVSLLAQAEGLRVAGVQPDLAGRPRALALQVQGA